MEAFGNGLGKCNKKIIGLSNKKYFKGQINDQSPHLTKQYAHLV